MTCCLPTKEAQHKVHPTDGAIMIMYAQIMHPKMSMKIPNLVSEGITIIKVGYVGNKILCQSVTHSLP